MDTNANAAQTCYTHTPKKTTSSVSSTEQIKDDNILVYVVDEINKAARPATPLKLWEADADPAAAANTTGCTRETCVQILARKKMLDFKTILTKFSEKLAMTEDKHNFKMAFAQYIDARICHGMLSELPNDQLQVCIDSDAANMSNVIKIIGVYFVHLIGNANTTDERGNLLTTLRNHLDSIQPLFEAGEEAGEINTQIAAATTAADAAAGPAPAPAQAP